MTSKTIVFLLFTLIVPLFSVEKGNEYTGAVAVLRPVLFRSEFVSRSTLRTLQQYSQQVGYTAFGYPDFGQAVITRDLCFWETKLAQTRYFARYLNKVYRNYYMEHPEIFSKETVEAARLGESWKNPVLKDGTKLEWHHGKNGYELRPQPEHHSLEHVGGAKTWGYKYAEAAQRLPNREIILTAQRWGKFAALELAFSTIGLAATGETSPEAYIVNTTASATAGFLAWGVESLIITAYPLTQGSTPLFIGGCMVNIGGPASWIASGVFFLSKYAIMSGWKAYQVHVAMEVEQRCRDGEKQVRFMLLKKNIKQNSNVLLSFVQE